MSLAARKIMDYGVVAVDPVITVGSIASDTSDVSTYSLTCTAVDAQAKRFLVGAGIYDAGSSVQTNINTMSHAGTNRTFYKNGSNIYLPTGFFFLEEPTGASYVLGMVGAAAATNGFASYFSVNGVNSLAFNQSLHTGALSITQIGVTITTVPANSIVLAYAVNSNNNLVTRTWLGVTELNFAYVNSDATVSAAAEHYPTGASNLLVRLTCSAADRMGLGVLVLTYT